MKSIRIFSQEFSSWRATNCSLVCLLLLTGCVARREALKANDTLVSASAEARVVVGALKTAAAAEAKAHAETRNAYRQLLTDYQAARRLAASEQMRAACQGTVAQMEGILNESISALHAKRLEVNKLLDGKLDAAFKPLTDKIAAYQLISVDAQKKVQEFPGDVARQTALKEADKNYLAASAVKLDKELDARAAVGSALDGAEAAASQRLQAAAEQFKRKLDLVLSRSLGGLATNADSKVDLGPEPSAHADILDGLAKYTDAVGKAAQGNRDYLLSNAFGRGSFFADFLNSLSKGILGGVLDPASVKGIDGDVVKASLKDVGGAALGSLKESLSDAKDSFKSTASEFVDNASSALMSKLNDALSQVLPAAEKAVVGQKSQP